MIEFRKNIDGKYELFIDGSLVNTEKAKLTYEHADNEDEFQISIIDEETYDRFSSHAFSELPPFDIDIFFEDHKLFNHHHNTFIHINPAEGNYKICFSVIGGGNWRGMHSFTEYSKELAKVIRVANDPQVQMEAATIDGIEDYSYLDIVQVVFINYRGSSLSLSISGEVARFASIMRGFHQEVIRNLNSQVRIDAVVTYFDFPEEVRVPCEQYLLYFAQFLRDLGVQADTALTHEAGQVLFTVTPADKEQALDKIRAALNAYLHLPSSPVSDTVNESIAVLRLESNILRLRSDLKLAAAELQAKNTTIEAQQLIIEVQKGLLSGEVIVNSMKDVTPKPKDKEKEELLGGTVSIIPLKGKGVEINLPELFRRLKRLFKEEE